jgi:hypothetical protein
VDINTWIGIIFFVLSIPMGVASTMLTPRVVSYLEKRKLIKSNRSREQEIAAYRGIEAFKNGSHDRYARYIAVSALSVIFAIGGATCVLLLALKYADFTATDLSTNNPTMALILLTAMFFLVSCFCIAIILTTARRIDRFDEYTAEIRAKWGNDAV